MKILDIDALQVLDSRGNPTLEVSVLLMDGSKGTFLVPSGASTGIHEAHELRDENQNYFHGKSVHKAVNNVYAMKQHLLSGSYTQHSLDQAMIELDGTDNKSLYGANAILGISVAFAKAMAQHYNIPLWEYLHRIYYQKNLTNKQFSELQEIHLFANVINGGLHSGNALNIQEFMIIPTEGDMGHKVRMLSEIYQVLKSKITEQYGKEATGVGDEGGFAPNISRTKEALDLLMASIKQANYEGEVALAIDAAASDFFDANTNKYAIEQEISYDYQELTEYYNRLIKEYPLISIEDPFAEDHYEAFSYFRKHVASLDEKNPLTGDKRVLVVGDDLLVTNPKRIRESIKKRLCNSLLLKINQIGTITESLEAHALSAEKGWHTIVSHRSGETTDSFIADLAVALGSSIKLGAPARGERVAKYNRLLHIYR